LNELSNRPSKGWLSQPENVVTILIIAVLGFCGVWFFAQLQNLFWQAVSGLVGLLTLGGIVLVLAWLIMADAPRFILGTLYRNAIRNTYRLIISNDPIGVMKNFTDRQQKNKDKFDEHIVEVQAQFVKMGRVLEKNARDAKQGLERAEKLRETGNVREAQLAAASAQGLAQSNQNMAPRYQLMQKILTFLNRASEAAGFTIQRTMDEVRTQQQEFELMESSGKAVNSAMKIFNDTSDERKSFDVAMEEVEDRVSTRTAEMERLMKMTEGVLSNMDADHAVILDHGIDLLDRYMNGEDISLDLSPQQAVASKVKGTLPPKVYDAEIIPNQKTSVKQNNSKSDW